MSRRFINCSACKGCHTGRGGQFCKFSSPISRQLDPELADPATGDMAMAQSDIPERGTPEYAEYLANQIAEEDRLVELKEKCRITSLEEQLASLRLQSANLQASAGLHTVTEPRPKETVFIYIYTCIYICMYMYVLCVCSLLSSATVCRVYVHIYMCMYGIIHM